MLKKLFFLVAGVFICAGLALAGTDDIPIDVSATVPTSAAYTMLIHPVNDGVEDWDTEVDEMAFGTLTHFLSTGDDAGTWYSRKSFMVIFYMSSGPAWNITQTGSYLVGDTHGATLPQGCFGFVPVYVSTDPGNTTTPRGTLGDAAYARGTNKPIYTSDAAGTGETIRAYYSIPPYPASGDPDWWTGWANVPLGQQADTYTGDVTFSVTIG